MTSVKVAVPGGTVYLAPKLTNAMGAASMAVLNGVDPTIGAMQAVLTEIYLSPAPAGGILSWEGKRFTHRNAEGIEEPEPITQESIERLIPWTEGGSEVAAKADELYAGDLFRPLARRISKSSEPGPTEQTSPTTGTGSKRQKQSRPSSPNGTAGMQSVVPVP